VTRKFELKPFQPEHFAEYAAWFVDPELDRHLGPIDQIWLEAVLSKPEAAGVTWAAFRGMELVAVVETVLDPEGRLPAAMASIATKPGLRRQGIGKRVLGQILSLHKRQGVLEHVAYVSMHNQGGWRCLEKAGFAPVAFEPDEQGYVEFRHHQ